MRIILFEDRLHGGLKEWALVERGSDDRDKGHGSSGLQVEGDEAVSFDVYRVVFYQVLFEILLTFKFAERRDEEKIAFAQASIAPGFDLGCAQTGHLFLGRR